MKYLPNNLHRPASQEKSSNAHIVKNYTKINKHTHKIITQNIKDKLQLAAKNKENNTMGRKYCT